MSHLAIIVGDTTDHGGTVITGANDFFIGNISLAHVGCEVICPLHGLTEIVTGQSTFLVSGHPVAIDGDLTSCGARLIAGQQTCFWIDGQPPAQKPAAHKANENPTQTTAFADVSTVKTSELPNAGILPFSCDERFRFTTAQRQPVGRLRYALIQDGQCRAEGTLDEYGMSSAHISAHPAKLTIAISAPTPALE